ncbi:two component transcriptional regulator, winged helix family [Desulfuromusa kysingii]|uniref:Two component transcriptional regulator, winged helix family n=1 Tax=Desulfuromusa kysingii TaxID=37625 RepID=A0A1H4DHR7_9BACT|nr:response regulator transcription factor [Desulfuromusa kysingii]SEA72137.1 two component transcriptional regulator, winged helix family [Desulfuromusa kysingii]
MNQILVIDDDIELCELLNDYLSGEGFAVATVNNGRLGAEQALAAEYVLVVLDVMLPEMNGFDVLRKIRENSKVPVIMLTARGDDIDRIVGLELGADDYLPKPFNPRELVARIRAIQRRVETAELPPTQQKPAELKVGDLVLYSSNRTVKRNGEKIDLTSVEFNLLEVLLSHAGEVISRDDLVEKVLGRRLSAYDRSIDVHVSALRKKLGHYDGNMERIRTIRGVGYLYSLGEN